LLGSIVARGVAERVFELEADADLQVVDRLVEVDLRGEFSFPRLGGIDQRPVNIRGKADRIDVLAGGGIRVVDYKLSRVPDTDHSIQIAVYAHAARQLLERQDGRAHLVLDAMYIAFGDENQMVGRLSKVADTSTAVEVRASEFAGVIDRIEAGKFPPQPKHPSNCQWCRYAGVCRKEYVLEAASE
jgi:RecB family exonuclease